MRRQRYYLYTGYWLTCPVAPHPTNLPAPVLRAVPQGSQHLQPAMITLPYSYYLLDTFPALPSTYLLPDGPLHGYTVFRADTDLCRLRCNPHIRLRTFCHPAYITGCDDGLPGGVATAGPATAPARCWQCPVLVEQPLPAILDSITPGTAFTLVIGGGYYTPPAPCYPPPTPACSLDDRPADVTKLTLGHLTTACSDTMPVLYLPFVVPCSWSVLFSWWC